MIKVMVNVIVEVTVIFNDMSKAVVKVLVEVMET